MRTSAAGRAAIKQREGCVLRWYLDSVGVWTCCVGHTGRAGAPAYRAGQTFSRRQADAILAADLAVMERAVSAAIKVPITQGQFDAAMSLVFNIGTTAFLRSTVLRRINAGRWVEAADAFLMWNKPPELNPRRRAERLQFLRGTRRVVKPAAAATAAPPPPRLPPRPAPMPKPTPAAPRPASLPPAIPHQPETPAMSTKVPFLAALLLVLFGISAANAGEIDFAPLVSAGVEYLVVPLLSSLAIWIAAQAGVLLKRVAARYPAYLDQKTAASVQQTAATFASNVNGVLDKAIAFGASQAGSLIGRSDLRANVDGWIASYAAEYAVKHAPDLMKQAGDVTQKIVARLADHPAVQEVKAQIELPAPLELHQGLAASA